MRLLFDKCLPRTLKAYFSEHDCRTVLEMGWAGKKNGDLLTIAEGAFDALITVDQGMSYQQNMRDRTLSILVIEALSNRIEDLANKVPGAKEALKSLEPGQIIRV